jgi:predicted acylesterase/phospholipase RssA
VPEADLVLEGGGVLGLGTAGVAMALPDAVRTSLSIPFYFEPWTLRNRTTGVATALLGRDREAARLFLARREVAVP